LPPEQTTKPRSKNGASDGGPASSNKQRERAIKQILRAAPIPLAVEEAEIAGFSPQEIQAALDEMWPRLAKSGFRVL
jgi:S-formylglutathione hydrolase FrmB